MREWIWKRIALLLARPAVASWLIARAARTPYLDIKNGADVYMGRWWLFNRYDRPRGWLRRLLPSVRVHHIRRPDADRHLHDHPWNARTIILRGGYEEHLPLDLLETVPLSRIRSEGDTGRLLFGEFHRIDSITEGGVWTLFITWRYRGTWGFLVDGQKVPYYEYLGLEEPK